MARVRADARVQSYDCVAGTLHIGRVVEVTDYQVSSVDLACGHLGYVQPIGVLVTGDGVHGRTDRSDVVQTPQVRIVVIFIRIVGERVGVSSDRSLNAHRSIEHALADGNRAWACAAATAGGK